METTSKRPSSPITGQEGAPIELDIAAQWTENYRHRHPNDTISQFFGQQILNTILNQPGCLGIRIYYANDQRLNGWQKFWVAVSNFLLSVIANVGGQKHFIITGVTADGQDQLPEENAQKAKTPAPEGIQTFALMSAQANILGEQSYPCPGSTGCPQNRLTGAAQ